MNQLQVQEKIKAFLLEDIRDRDITSETIFPVEQYGEGIFIAKADGIFSGEQIIVQTYQLLNPSIEVVLHKHDGDILQNKDAIAIAKGPVRDLLTGERVILNLIQRMSGIATCTNQAIKALDSQTTKICDTRKTTPGLRMFEKYAVTCGGGYNHRYGLYDGVMIKDNHISFCGSIKDAVAVVRKKIGHMVKIEVEAENIQQVMEAVEAKADVIMLDNRTPEEIVELVKLIPESIITEASGNITVENINRYKQCGVDYISLGSLTHSAKALDISFQVK